MQRGTEGSQSPGCVVPPWPSGENVVTAVTVPFPSSPSLQERVMRRGKVTEVSGVLGADKVSLGIWIPMEPLGA